MKKANLIRTVSIFSTVALLAGCGGATTDTKSSTQASNTSGTKSLIFGRGGDSITLDPANSTDSESNYVAEEIADTLVQYKPGTSELTGDLATDWQVSSDGLAWTFHLVKDAKFQDGSPFNADAVIFNFNRWWDTTNPYHKGSFSHFHSDLGGFKGEKNSVIKDIKKVDDSTVEFDLTHPYAPFAAMLSQVAFAIASPDNIKKNNGDLSKELIGTGPFKFVSWSADDKLILQKNQDYRKKGLPKLDQLIFQVIKDNKARLNALQAGQIDLMEGLNPSDTQTVKSDSTLQLYTGASNNIGYLAFNTQKKPFTDAKVRQAINMVIDKQALIDAYLNGYAEPAATVLPTKNWAFDSSISSYPVDIQKAKQLLAEAGYPNGFTTEIWAMPVPRPYMPQPEKVATAIQADLQKIGIEAKVVTYDWATYLKKTANGDFTMCLLGWSAGTWDPTTFMYTLLHGDNAKAPATNTAFYQNPEVDQLLNAAMAETDQTKRAALYQQAQQIVHKDAPMVDLWHTIPTWAGSKNVSGFIPLVGNGTHFETAEITK